jgi:O-antigen/teichoic acid export membrane protein
LESKIEVLPEGLEPSPRGLLLWPRTLVSALPKLKIGGIGRQLATVAGWSLAAALIARGANLIAMILCARILHSEEFGKIAILQSTVGMFGPLAALGLSMTATKFVAEYRDTDRLRAGRILTFSLVLAWTAGLIMTGVLILLAPQIAQWGFASPGLKKQLVEASGLLVLGVLESVQTGALTGFEAFSRIAKLSAWSGMLSIPAITILAYRYHDSGAIAGLTIALALTCVLNSVALRAECRRRGIPLIFRGCLSERRILVGFSLPSYLSGAIVAPVNWLANTLLVSHSGGFSQVGLYSAADRYRFLLIFVPLSISRIAVPTLSRFHAAGDDKGFHEASRWNVGFGLVSILPPALLCVLLAPRLMSLFGASFVQGWPVLAVLALSSIPTVLNTQLGAVLLSSGRAWTRTAVDGLLAAVFVGSAYALIPRWNSIGLATAFLVSYSFAVAVLCICLRKKMPVIEEYHD